MTKKYGYIYQIKNLVNGKKYIGQTIRKRGHRQFPSGYKGNIHLYRSYKKYGIENFEITVIDDARNQKKLNKKEEFYIQKFNTLNPDFGYNKQHGGSKGKLTQKTKDLMSFSRVHIIFSKDYLKQEYLTNGKSVCQIALENNCTTSPIRRKLKEYNIPIRNISFTKKFLKQEYLKNKKSTFEIAKENNCSQSTISLKLREYNIPIKKQYFSFTKEFLEQEYLTNKKTLFQIAKENNCSYNTILRKLRKYNISLKRISFTKEFLKQEYLINKKTLQQIAEENNCVFSTISRKLKEYNIPIRTKNISFTKEFLEQEYLTKKKSMRQIGKENNCVASCIFQRLKKYNIPTRTTAEIRRISFTKEFLEQEYLINEKTMYQIADENNCSYDIIYSRLREYNIPRR